MVDELQGRISVRPGRDPYGYVPFGPNLDKLFALNDGDFYGPNAEEFAGYFERTMGGYDLRGVFGGKRETDDE